MDSSVGDFTVELVTHELGLVVRYGPELWTAITSSGYDGN